MRLDGKLFLGLLLGVVCLPLQAICEPGPSREEVLKTLRKAAEFFVTRVATPAGYHGRYTEELSSGRGGNAGEGPTRISGHGPETVSNATPAVGLAFLEAWEATGDRYYLEAARGAAYGMLKGQMCSGGWDERVTELDPARRKNYEFRADGGCRSPEEWSRDWYEPHQTADKQVGDRRNMTNMDNNITQSVVRMMMRVDRALNFEDKDIHEGTLHALDQLVLAQYPVGAWPRNYEKCGDPKLFPVIPASYPQIWSFTWTRPAFYSWYIINDDCTLNVMDAMLEAARIYKEPKYLASAERAGVFIILAQMPDPQPAWAQQYNPKMQPCWARSMEPPAITGRESISVLKALIALYRETGKKKYLEPIPRALDYLKQSSFMRNGRHLLARFYELKTNQPLYITPGSPNTRVITYSDARIKRGYSFFANAEPLERIEEEYKHIVTAKPETLRRPEKLKGLSPFVSTPTPPLPRAELTKKVRAAISALDDRGAWVHPDAGGGTTPPVQRMIFSGTFVANVKLLSDYLLAME